MVGDLVLVNCAVFDGRGDHSRPDTGIWVRDGVIRADIEENSRRAAAVARPAASSAGVSPWRR